MKIYGAVLSLIILAATLCSQVNASPLGIGISTTCCVNFAKKIPSKMLMTYKTTRSQCDKKGVIFITKRGFKICANPKEEWVQQIMKQLDDQKAKTQNS